MISQHFPILQIVIPLIAAPMCIIIKHHTAVKVWAIIISWLSFAIAIAILLQVLDSGTVIYELGSWATPWGIEYRIDILNAFILIIVSGIGAIVMPYSWLSVKNEIVKEREYLFYCMLLLCITGLMGIAITGDAFNLFVFMEISSLSSYVLISFGQDRRALIAAYRYLIMGTIGATFYMIGVGFLYAATGTLNIFDLGLIVPEISDSRTVQVALAFLTVGLCIKLALFPLHMWLPNAYTYAPSVVSVFLASTATKVSIYALLRVLFTIFGGVEILEILPIRGLLIGMAAMAMIYGSIQAIYQINVKRMLAYSSIAQIGYVVLGLSFDNATGIAAGIIHLFNHALMKGSLFMVLGAVMYRVGSVQLNDMAGLGKDMPLTMAAFFIAGLSLIGVPLTVGFVSKWYLIQAALENGWWPIAILIVISSLLAVVYIWRIIEVIYFTPANPEAQEVREAPISLLLPTWILLSAVIYFGIDATTALNIAIAAADTLLVGGGS